MLALGCSLPGSSVHGIFQATILEWVAISFSRGSSWSRNPTHFSYVICIAGRFFTCWAIGNLIRLMLALWNEFGGFSLLYFGRIWEILILILWIFGRIHQWSHVVQKNFFGRLSITNLIFVCVCIRIFRYCFFMIQSYRLHMCVCICTNIYKCYILFIDPFIII